MTKLNYSPVGSIPDTQGSDEGNWLCRNRLPEGVTLVTGIAGAPCSKKLLETVALDLYTEYAEMGEVEGEQAREGAILYVQLEGSEQKMSRRLRAAFEDDAPEGALAGVWPGKMSMEMAEAVGESAEDAECGIVVIDGAHVGCEGRQKLSTVLAELNRKGKGAGCAIIVLMPLTKRNMFCVKDPTTGIWGACEAIWEIYADSAGAVKCFCTTKDGGASAFELKTTHSLGRRGSARQMPTTSESIEEVAVDDAVIEKSEEVQEEERSGFSWGEGAE